MIEVEALEASLAATACQQISAFIATHDRSDPASRLIIARLAERAHGEIYRREREIYVEWIDVGGEA